MSYFNVFCFSEFVAWINLSVIHLEVWGRYVYLSQHNLEIKSSFDLIGWCHGWTLRKHSIEVSYRVDLCYQHDSHDSKIVSSSWFYIFLVPFHIQNGRFSLFCGKVNTDCVTLHFKCVPKIWCWWYASWGIWY